MNIQGWFPLGLTGFISLLSKGLSRVSSNTTIWKHQFFSAQSSLVQFSHLYVTTGETTALTIQTIVSKVTISLSIFVTFCILNAQEVTDMSKKYSICWMNKWVNKLQSFHYCLSFKEALLLHFHLDKPREELIVYLRVEERICENVNEMLVTWWSLNERLIYINYLWLIFLLIKEKSSLNAITAHSTFTSLCLGFLNYEMRKVIK